MDDTALIIVIACFGALFIIMVVIIAVILVLSYRKLSSSKPKSTQIRMVSSSVSNNEYTPLTRIEPRYRRLSIAEVTSKQKTSEESESISTPPFAGTSTEEDDNDDFRAPSGRKRTLSVSYLKMRTKDSFLALEPSQAGKFTHAGEIAPDELPVHISKTDLDFGLGATQMPVGRSMSDVVVLRPKPSMKKDVVFSFSQPKSQKFNFTFSPKRGKVKKGKDTRIKITLTVNCTTKIRAAVRINFRDIGFAILDCFLLSELSPFIDYDEIKFDGQKRLLGEGALARVYYGEYRGMQVAVKKFKLQTMPEYVRVDFERELNLLSSIRHQNVVQFVGASVIEGKLATLSELAPLGSVADIIKTKRLSVNLKLKFAWDAAMGLHYLHKGKIMHRDIKTENMLVFSMVNDALVNVKLADFGMSRAINPKADRLTGTTGTPNYMAPEVMLDDNYSLKADIYSFGLVLWELYMQRPAFENIKKLMDLKEHVVCGEREDIPNDCPTGLKNLIQRCWAGKAEERPNSGQLAKRLAVLYSNALRSSARRLRNVNSSMF